MDHTALNHTAWNPLHSIGMNFIRLHGIHCIQSSCMESTAFNGMFWAMLHKIHCIQSCSKESTASNRDILGHAA